ncbi:PTS mannose/fructose/sorbose/N-acetylgalactosamine transporter subunit IIC [Vagococcus acidifermentans]|uniref:PTS N-acetylgalactosamine transporter subunit IID n=1 Tax=Vagococcus acidifermentans TaxID=564710 RepID=A0A430B2T3_9ENTE|nr:PTS sugar transporter subunit IIC [Vagococcus acidifermentans]RSU14640.1 PTS N-acetylgalactosamine transporter subunit IID [Vagococcus acidifermentans]
MQISIVQSILIGLVYYLGINGTPWITLVGTHGWMRPLVNGTIVGLILGDPVQGCIIGAAINLPYLAFISAGGTVAMDPALAGTLGTALAMAANVEPAVAVTLAVPLGLLGTLVWVAHMTVDITFVHMADKAAEKGDIDRINFLHIVPPQLFLLAITVIPVALASYLGADAVAGVIDKLGGKPLEVLSTIGGILPALGIAMNLRSMNGKGTLIFFLLGFLLSIYSGLPTLPISVFAAVIAYVFTELYLNKKNGRAA